MPNIIESDNKNEIKQKQNTLPANILKNVNLSSLYADKDKAKSINKLPTNLLPLEKSSKIVLTKKTQAPVVVSLVNEIKRSPELLYRTKCEESSSCLLTEIERLKKCMQFLEAENEQLSQRLEKEEFRNKYNEEIEGLISQSFENNTGSAYEV